MSATLYAPGLDNLRLDRIVITARAVGVPLDVIRDEAAASAKCRELSPFGQAPVLVLPTGHPVARTHAIMRALAGLADHLSLAGYSVFEEASVDQWLNWTFFELEPLAMVLTVKAVRDSLKPTDLALAEKAAASKAGPALAQLDSHLASRTFLVAQQLTIADISAAVVAGAIWDSPALSAAVKGGLPYLARWLLTCRNQPVFLAGAGAKAAAPAHAAAAPSASSAAPAPASSSSGAAAMPAGPGVSSTTGHGLPTSLTAVHTSLPSEKFVRARQRISDVLHAGEALIGSSVTVCGWARTIREADKGALQFIALNDGSVFESIQVSYHKPCLPIALGGVAQCDFEWRSIAYPSGFTAYPAPESYPEPQLSTPHFVFAHPTSLFPASQVVAERAKTEGFECIAKAGGTGSSFRIVGTVVRSPAKGQAIELAATSVTLLGEVQDSKEYPLAKKKHTLEYLRVSLFRLPLGPSYRQPSCICSSRTASLTAPVPHAALSTAGPAAPAPSHQHRGRGGAHPQRVRLRDAHVLPGARLPVRPHAHRHRRRLRGRWRDVPGHHAAAGGPQEGREWGVLNDFARRCGGGTTRACASFVVGYQQPRTRAHTIISPPSSIPSPAPLAGPPSEGRLHRLQEGLLREARHAHSVGAAAGAFSEGS